MKVVVFEPTLKGHHGLWVAETLDALRAVDGADVTLATGPSFESALERVPALAAASNGIAVTQDLASSDDMAMLERSRTRTRELAALLRQKAPDWVYVLYADGMSQVGAVSASLRSALRRSGAVVEAIQFRSPVCYPEYGGRARSRIHWVASELAPWTYRHHVDPLFVEGPRAPRHLHRWSVFPDLVDPPERAVSRAEARQLLGLPVEGRLVVAPGLLGGVKGTVGLTRAFLAARRRKDDVLVLAGPHDPQLAAFVAQCRDDSLLSRDQWIDPAQLRLYLQAATAVATPYPAHVGSASIVLRAASCGRFVLGSTTGWQGPMIPAFGLGLAVEPTTDALRRGVEVALDRGDGHVASPASRHLLDFHSPANFRAHVVGHIASQVRAGAAAAIGWDRACGPILREQLLGRAAVPSAGPREWG